MGISVLKERSLDEQMRLVLDVWTSDSYEIDDGKITVHGDVFIEGVVDETLFGDLPYEFDTIDGDFSVKNIYIQSMKGFPRTVNGNFIMQGCYSLISDEDVADYCPDKIQGLLLFIDTPFIYTKIFCVSCDCDSKKVYEKHTNLSRNQEDILYFAEDETNFSEIELYALRAFFYGFNPDIKIDANELTEAQQQIIDYATDILREDELSELEDFFGEQLKIDAGN